MLVKETLQKINNYFNADVNVKTLGDLSALRELKAQITGEIKENFPKLPDEKELGAFCSIRYCTITEEDFTHQLEFSLTLYQWRVISDKSIKISNEEFIQIYPHLKRLIQE
jgi:hypothetical protein